MVRGPPAIPIILRCVVSGQKSPAVPEIFHAYPEKYSYNMSGQNWLYFRSLDLGLTAKI